MLLPQAGAFNTLRERIQVVQSGLLLEAQRDSSRDDSTSKGWFSGSKDSEPQSARQASDIASLLDQFDNVTEARQL